MNASSSRPDIARRSTELAFPLIGATYAAQMTERIYKHLRNQLESDDDIYEEIDEIMKKSPSVLKGGPQSLKTKDGRGTGTLRTLAGNAAPNDSLFEHIERHYNDLNDITYQRFLKNARHRLQRRTTQQKIGYEDKDISFAQGELDDKVKLAEKQLELRLSDRTYSPEVICAND